MRMRDVSSLRPAPVKSNDENVDVTSIPTYFTTLQPRHNQRSWGVAISNDGRFLASAGDRDDIFIHDATDPIKNKFPLVTKLPGATNVWSVHPLAFSDCCFFFACGAHEKNKSSNKRNQSHGVRIYAVPPPLTQQEEEEHNTAASASSSASSSSLSSWKLLSPPSPLVGHTQEVTCVAFSKNSKKLATCAVDGDVLIYDLPVESMRANNNNIEQEEESEKKDDEVQTRTEEEQQQENEGTKPKFSVSIGGRVFSCIFSPDEEGKYVLCGNSDNHVFMIDSNTGTKLLTIENEFDRFIPRIHVLSMNEKDKMMKIAVLSFDGMLKIMQIQLNSQTASYSCIFARKTNERSFGLSFSSCGSVCAVIHANGYLEFYDLTRNNNNNTNINNDKKSTNENDDDDEENPFPMLTPFSNDSSSVVKTTTDGILISSFKVVNGMGYSVLFSRDNRFVFTCDTHGDVLCFKSPLYEGRYNSRRIFLQLRYLGLEQEEEEEQQKQQERTQIKSAFVIYRILFLVCSFTPPSFYEQDEDVVQEWTKEKT